MLILPGGIHGSRGSHQTPGQREGERLDRQMSLPVCNKAINRFVPSSNSGLLHMEPLQMADFCGKIWRKLAKMCRFYIFGRFLQKDFNRRKLVETYVVEFGA